MKILHLAVIVILSSVIAVNVEIAFADEGPESLGPGPVQNSSKRIDIPVTFAPISVAVNPVTNMIYTAHTSLADSVSVISGKTNKTISEIKVGQDPALVKVNPVTNMIYVTNTNSHSVSVISGLINKVVDTVQVGGFPGYILINTGTNTIYIASGGSNTISVIDGKTNNVVTTIPVCNISGAVSIFAMDQTENTIYVTCTGPDGAIDVISGTTNKVVDTISVGRDPTNVVFNPKTHMLYTANNGDYTVSVVSAKTDKVVDTIPVELFPSVVAVNPDTNMIYVANNFNSSSNKLSVIDGQTNKVVAKIPIGSGAQNIAIDSSDNIIYVANYASNSISVISGRTNTLIDTIPVGALPTSIAINDITKTVYVANWRSDFVSMIPITSLDLQTTEANADNSNDVYIQDIQVTPSTVKVGEAFTVSATLVNNSTFPIFVDGGKCSAQDVQAELFTITLDNHVKNKAENIYCAGVGWSQLLDPGKSITGTSGYTTNYMATESGTATITVAFSYHSLIQKDPSQTSAEQTVSKSLQFQIRDVNSDSSGPPVPETPSPLQQFKSGVKAEDVKCNSGFILAINLDYSPACVTKSSATKLFLRGWALGFTNYRPVYFMESGSAAQVVVQYHPRNNRGNALPDIQLPLHSWMYGLKSDYPVDSNEIKAIAKPDYIHTSSVSIVNYTITAGNTKGVYWLSILDPCVLVPIAVNLDESQVTTMDLQSPADSRSCPPPEVQFHVVGIYNATLKLIGVD
ncbi:MAG: YncE family protein [Thaumarchaeota archaeon]|nr:YncE family protein [Nitrososphaerota archaeon]